MRIVVTGANRGIGLELVRQLAARGDDVFAGARDPERARELASIASASDGRVLFHACDVRDDRSVRAFAAAAAHGPLQGSDVVDAVINNAGVMGKMQSLEQLDLDDVKATFDADAIGPIRVTRALLPQIRKSSVRKVMHVSSGMGSIGDNTSGGAYGYRMAKAALNMASRSMALDLRGERVISVVVNPGWVTTDMGGRGANTPVEDSVRGLLKLLDRITLADSGSFLDFRGGTIEW